MGDGSGASGAHGVVAEVCELGVRFWEGVAGAERDENAAVVGAGAEVPDKDGGVVVEVAVELSEERDLAGIPDIAVPLDEGIVGIGSAVSGAEGACGMGDGGVR